MPMVSVRVENYKQNLLRGHYHRWTNMMSPPPSPCVGFHLLSFKLPVSLSSYWSIIIVIRYDRHQSWKIGETNFYYFKWYNLGAVSTVYTSIMYICLSVSVYLSICLSVYLSIYLSVYLSIYLSVYIFMFITVDLSICLFYFFI